MSAFDGRPYNYQHFLMSHVVAEVAHTVRLRGVGPGRRAPDFELLDTEGEPWRLSEHLDRPVLLHFGSYS